MQLEKIAQYDDGKGLTFQERIAKANNLNLYIPSNLQMDARLQGEEWKKEKEMYPCSTGTLIAHEAPGRSFCKTIEYEGLTFNVPKPFQGKKDLAIVCNHPDFLLNDDLITLGKSAKAIPFPRQDGWYLPDKQFGIPDPTHPSKDDTPMARYLWRRDDEAYIGLVSRDGGRWGVGGRRDVDAYYGPGDRLGVFGTATGKFKLPPHKHVWACKDCGELKESRI